MRRTFSTSATMAIAILLTNPAWAQAPAPAAPPQPARQGQSVAIQEVGTPSEVRGRLVHLGTDVVTILRGTQQIDFPLERVSKVQVLERDSVVNGAVTGALIAGLWCLLVCGQGLDSSDQLSQVALANAGLGALIGGAIDWKHTGRRTIYEPQAKHAGPPGLGRAVSFSVRF